MITIFILYFFTANYISLFLDEEMSFKSFVVNWLFGWVILPVKILGLHKLYASHYRSDKPKDYVAAHPDNRTERSKAYEAKLKAAMEVCNAPCCNPNYPNPRR